MNDYSELRAKPLNSEEREELRKWHTKHGCSYIRLLDEVDNQAAAIGMWKAEVERLRAALAFYAAGKHIGYRDSVDIRVDGDEYVRDRGDHARVALNSSTGVTR